MTHGDMWGRMGHKIFVSYKYHDDNVQPFRNSTGCLCRVGVRDYVNVFEAVLEETHAEIFKGERDGDILTQYVDDTIWEKLKDRIYDSSVTALFISPNMVETGVREKDQWIPWEISYSLREQSRNGRTSHANALVGVVLPDRQGSYSYCRYMNHFKIVESNIRSGYMTVVDWDRFILNVNKYIDAAMERSTYISPDEDI